MEFGDRRGGHTFLRWDSPWVIAIVTLAGAVAAWWKFGSTAGGPIAGPTAAAAVAAIGAIFNGAVQLSRTAASQRADFLLRLHDDFFFRAELARIRKAIDAEQLSVHVEGLTADDPPYTPPAPRSEPAVVAAADDLDDYLGYLELVESFLKAGMLDISVAHKMFAHYVEWALMDPAVDYYVEWISVYPGHRGPFFTDVHVLNNRFRRWERRWDWLMRWFKMSGPLDVLFSATFAPHRFARLAAEEDLQESLRQNPASIPEERREGWLREQAAQRLTAINDVRRSVAFSFLLLALVVVVALLIAFSLRVTRHLLLSSQIRGVRLTSIGILAWATLGRLGWKIQTIAGRTLPERFNDYWFRSLYLIGAWLGALSVFAEVI